jgi:hypothetical protein
MQTDSVFDDSLHDIRSPAVNPQGDDFVQPVEVEMISIVNDIEKGKHKSKAFKNEKKDVNPENVK